MARKTIEMFKAIRGTEVIVYATSFDGDPSVGIPYGPEEVFAKDHDGNDFELTDTEVEQLGVEATEAYEDNDPDYD